MLLYNSEVWVIGKGEMKALEGKVVYLMRKVGGEKVRKEEEGDRLSNQKLREMLGLEPVGEMIRKRRLQWVAHSARRGQRDYTWRGMRKEVEDPKSGWGEQLRENWRELGVKDADDWMKLVKEGTWLRRELKKLTSEEAEGEEVTDQAEEL